VLWRAKWRVVAVSFLAGAITFVALSTMRPFYTSEARILVQNQATAFTRPANEQGSAGYQAELDAQAVRSQVQFLKTRDHILRVVNDLGLFRDEHFLRDADATPIDELLDALGLSYTRERSPQERAANTVARHLDVRQLSNTSVVAIEYQSGDPQLAADIASKLADGYVAWQRDAKIEETKAGETWVDAQIDALRKATADSEAALESLKAPKALSEPGNNAALNAQQLSELNSELVLVEAQKSEAQTRAELTEQSAVLLPAHPRMKQLKSELAHMRAQIRIEAQKVVKSLENRAQFAAAREASLRASLNDAKTLTAGQSSAQAKLQALEREAKANRDLLNWYLARARDASSGDDVSAVPSQAAIVSHAHASVLPNYPRRGPIALLVAATTALLMIAGVLAKAMLEGGRRKRRQQSLQNVPAGGAAALRLPVEPVRDQRRSAAGRARDRTRPKKSQDSARRTVETAKSPSWLPVEDRPSASPNIPRSLRQARANKDHLSPDTAPPLRKAPANKRAAAKTGVQFNPAMKIRGASRKQPTTKSKGVLAALAAPSSTVVARTAADAEAAAAAGKPSPRGRSPMNGEVENGSDEVPMSNATTEDAPSASSRDLMRRFRQDAIRQSEVPRVANAPRRRSGGPRQLEHDREERPLQPNDLRHYLTQRIPSSSMDEHPQQPLEPSVSVEELGPAIASPDDVIDTILEISTGGAPRTALVAGLSSHSQSAQTAIGIARDLAGRNAQVALVDLAKGSAVVSGQLNMPRVPGFSELADGVVDFADVIKLDEGTTLQVIPAGDPNLNAGIDAPDKFMRIFEALTQTYDCVVLHADMDCIEDLMPALKFELPVAVAVLPPKTAPEDAEGALSIVQHLGCPIVLHGDPVARKRHRFSLFGSRGAG
jgi:uncharacterized protein involved in exopolysaccharide biosynthesis